MDAAAKVTSKGQVTIPKAVRDALGLKVGDEVIFRVEGNRAARASTPRWRLRRGAAMRARTVTRTGGNATAVASASKSCCGARAGFEAPADDFVTVTIQCRRGPAGSRSGRRSIAGQRSRGYLTRLASTTGEGGDLRSLSDPIRKMLRMRHP